MRSDFFDVHYLNVLYMCMKFTVSVLIDLYCQNPFFTSYQQKETGGNKQPIKESDLLRQELQQIRLVETLRKSLYRCFRRIMCFSPLSWLFSNSILKLYNLRNSIIGL
jgi:hypothetical protein